MGKTLARYEKDGNVVKYVGPLVKRLEYKKGNEKDRVETHYNSAGGIFMVIPFKNNKEHGTGITYYPTGEKWRETPYVNGEIHGVQISFDKSGKVTSRITYERGVYKGFEHF